ncbi:MAG TPA: polymorphic toxin-type HINT domain-containing protein, partial [Planctomycetia bacterium]|nr:polymorphic toxin-type HINT domain-containing protein [Planctomycetia bacterium]
MLAFEMIIAAGTLLAGDLDAKQRWERGEVFHRGSWKPAVAVEAAPIDRGFVERRRKTDETGPARWKLALWAKEHDSPEDFKAQALVAQRLGYRGADLHRALGRKLRNGVWGTEAEFDSRARIFREHEALNKEWTAKLSALPVPPREIPAISDPRAIPVFEREVSAKSEAGAALVVDRLRSIPHQAATSSLARHAVFASGEKTRAAAAAALLERPADAFVPMMLDWTTVVQSTFQVAADGAPVWFWRDFDRDFFAGIRTGERPLWQSGDIHVGVRFDLKAGQDGAVTNSPRRPDRQGSAVDVSGRAPVWTTLAELHARSVADKLEPLANAVAERAERTRGVLAKVAGKDLGDDVNAWKQWWGQVNDQFIDHDADGAQRSTVDESTVVATLSCSSCFRFDTPVWTERGLRPIHEIELGDRVLAKDLRSGELTYKPVIFRTLLPRTRMRELAVGGEVVHATMLHPFWAEGRGWTKARELSSGATLKTYNGASKLD